MKQSDRIDEAEVPCAASPEQIFAAFTDPERVARWMPPEGMRAEIDLWLVEPGEPYRMTLIYTGDEHQEGKAGHGRDEVVGRFLSVEPPCHVVQEAEFPSDDPANSGIMQLEWLFERDDAGSRLRVRASSVPISIDAADHRAALHQTLEQLCQEAARDR